MFIADFKFWKGPKAFGEAIDQLLGYATWRDSKTAILVFNRGVETSKVLSAIDGIAKSWSLHQTRGDSGYCRFAYRTASRGGSKHTTTSAPQCLTRRSWRALPAGIGRSRTTFIGVWM